jgi:hypothetical protein
MQPLDHLQLPDAEFRKPDVLVRQIVGRGNFPLQKILKVPLRGFLQNDGLMVGHLFPGHRQGLEAVGGKTDGDERESRCRHMILSCDQNSKVIIKCYAYQIPLNPPLQKGDLGWLVF